MFVIQWLQEQIMAIRRCSNPTSQVPQALELADELAKRVTDALCNTNLREAVVQGELDWWLVQVREWERT